jgi:hypothetical protein
MTSKKSSGSTRPSGTASNPPVEISEDCVSVNA